MKALSALARVALVPRDPVAALAAAVILLSLVQEDALPAYGASYSAAVLLRHVLLQVSGPGGERNGNPRAQSGNQHPIVIVWHLGFAVSVFSHRHTLLALSP
jgi:hypothetical protein